MLQEPVSSGVLKRIVIKVTVIKMSLTLFLIFVLAVFKKFITIKVITQEPYYEEQKISFYYFDARICTDSHRHDFIGDWCFC